MGCAAFDKLTASRKRWRKTIGEHVLRAGGVGLAIAAIAIGMTRAVHENPGGPPIPYRVIRTEPGAPKRVLLVASEPTPGAEGFAEAIRSYFGARVMLVPSTDASVRMVDRNDCVVVLSNSDAASGEPPFGWLTAAVEKKRPIYWIGRGLPAVAQLLGFPRFEEQPETEIPANSFLTYKGIDVDGAGVPFVPGYPPHSAGLDVLATVRVHDAFVRPAAVRSPRATYLAFDPFPRSGGPLALPVAIDLLADALGRHHPDPRVIFRLEDVNALDYGRHDSAFARVAERLAAAGVFAHVAITPVSVDADGNERARIDGAPAMVDVLDRNRARLAVALHGTRHHRADPRNAGKPSGDAYEFFFDDDDTMGSAAAARFAAERLTEGRDLMRKSGFEPLMFEAPHLEMSPGEEDAARRLFPVMMHPPLFFGRPATRFAVQVPWLTERAGTIYAPSDVGYVDALDERSVDAILARLEQLRGLLPDPVVVVFYHPFMIDKPGRADDLPRLIQGFRRFGYRAINLLHEVEPIADKADSAAWRK